MVQSPLPCLVTRIPETWQTAVVCEVKVTAKSAFEAADSAIPPSAKSAEFFGPGFGNWTFCSPLVTLKLTVTFDAGQ